MAVTDPFNPALQEHAEAIGYVCINWAWLEFVVDCAFVGLIDMPTDKHEGHCIVTNMDFRKKLDTIKALGFIRKPSGEWFEDWEALINKIDNTLRPERNRFVHDLWRNEGGTSHPTKTKALAKIVKPQAKTERILQTHDTAEVDLKKVRALSTEIVGSGKALVTLLAKGKLLGP